ncbi:hypothetical protein M5K25_017938 [Dendrobium thyrsiflorum]|uniref:Uncharacterized protein n=1 Tax=Dendrobium thyrsiflorum TaxID=117978 RepID=A0ABD0UNW3_DENTH
MLEEEHSVQLLIGNSGDKMQPFLCMATITIFHDLLNIVAKFKKLNLLRSENHSDKRKKAKTSDARKGETYSMSSPRPNKGGGDRLRKMTGIECKRPEESKHIGDSNYCPYNQVINHPIEDFCIFKDCLERKYRMGELTLLDNMLAHHIRESTRVVMSSFVHPLKEEEMKRSQLKKSNGRLRSPRKQ